MKTVEKSWVWSNNVWRTGNLSTPHFTLGKVDKSWAWNNRTTTPKGLVTSALFIAPSPPATSNPVFPGEEKWGRRRRRKIVRRESRKEREGWVDEPMFWSGEQLRDKKRQSPCLSFYSERRLVTYMLPPRKGMIACFERISGELL